MYEHDADQRNDDANRLDRFEFLTQEHPCHGGSDERREVVQDIHLERRHHLERVIIDQVRKRRVDRREPQHDEERGRRKMRQPFDWDGDDEENRSTNGERQRRQRQRIDLIIARNLASQDAEERKADQSQEPGSTLARAPLNRQLGIQFFPVVAFTVNCKPADAKPADNHRDGSKRSINGACRVSESVVFSAKEIPGNTRALA